MGKTFRLTLILVLVCIIGSAAFISYKVFFDSPARSIPLLKGSSVIEAVEVLARMGIKARIDQEDSALPRGTVISQWPETGMKLRADKTAILKVSRGSAKMPLPDLRGLTQQQAVKRLQDEGFIVGEIVKVNHERPAGVVAAQNPSAPASIPQGREVSLMVSLGPTVGAGQVIVPDLQQQYEKTALQLAQQSGLTPRVQYIYSSASPKGMVIAMSPAAGRKVSRGSEVLLTVASWDRSLIPVKKTSDDEPVAGGSSSGGAKVVVLKPQTDPEKARQLPSGSRDEEPGALAPSDVNTPPASAPGESQLKTAAIRYQAPPVKNQTLRIEIIDRKGTRDLLNRKANAGEYIKLDVPYTGEAVVTIYLGGNFVWQDRFK